MVNLFHIIRMPRGRNGSRNARINNNQPEPTPALPQDPVQNVLQGLQQQNELILQALQNLQTTRAVPSAEASVLPPAPPRRNRRPTAPRSIQENGPADFQEATAEVQGPLHPEQGLPPPPPLRPQRNLLPEFIKCNRYFEGLPGKPEEAEDWLAQIERSLDVFQVPEALKVPYGGYMLRLRARIW